MTGPLIDVIDIPEDDHIAYRYVRTPMRDGGGALYVLEIGTDRIKVGWSRAPKARLASHRAAARAHGVGSGREWTSPLRADDTTEGALVDYCKARATEQVSREYFVGVRFEDAAQKAAELTNYTVDWVRGCVYSGSPNTKWHISNVANLLHTSEGAARDLVARGELAARYPEDDFDQFPETSRRALLDWLDTEPDLLALPRSSS